MANLQRYTKINVYVDGSLLFEEIDVTVRRSTNSQEVKTVAKGYSGESPGAAMCEIDVNNAFPEDGMEFDVGSAMANLTPVEMTQFAGGKTMTVKGFIIEDTAQHGVDKAAGVSFKFRGPMPQWV